MNTTAATTATSPFITEGLFRGVHTAAARRIRLDVANWRAQGWPEIEVIQLRTNAINAARITRATA